VRLTPRDTRFYGMFAESAAHILTGAGLLSELLAAEPDARPSIAERMQEAEHAADETTHLIMSTVNSTFITPFDREDIYGLASRLDDVMDAMEAAVDLVVLYAIDDLPEEFSDQVRVLARAAELTAEAMPRLRTMRNLSDYWIEINRLENEADAIYRRAIAELFKPGNDPIDVMKWRDIFDNIESATDRCEDVANIVEGVVLEYA
jgi:uncharacterized protein